MTVMPDTAPDTASDTAPEAAPGAAPETVTTDPALALKSETAPWLRWLDYAMRGAGFVVAMWLTVFTAAFEAFLTPLYWDGYRLPVSAVAAVVVNLGLIWFTVTVTGRRMPVAAIAVVWVAVIVVASTKTGEGDLVLTDNNWVGIVTMLAGSLTFAVAGYRLVLTAFRPKI
jgi:hypothetical protein